MKRLSDAEWQTHPLNRLSGGMLAVLLWTSAQLLFSLLLIVAFLTEGTGVVFLDGVPDAYEWCLWVAMIAGPFLIVPSILTKRPSVPWLFTGYILLTFLLLIGAEAFELNWFSAARYAEPGGWIPSAIFAAAVSVDLIVIRYLFLGRRPNVIFRRREIA
ncbi:MAG: hypothetical protein AAGE80_13585 [Pseudomonadota bacterium]